MKRNPIENCVKGIVLTEESKQRILKGITDKKGYAYKSYFGRIGFGFVAAIMVSVFILASAILGNTNQIVITAYAMTQEGNEKSMVLSSNKEVTLMPAETPVGYGYIFEMDKAMAQADLIICRAGATTLAEVTALGVAAILVPSPYVAHNHQYYNASVLVDAHAAFMIEEKDLCADSLNQAISAIMDDPIRLEEMKVRARELGKPNACADILDWCEELKGGIKK